MLPYDVVFWGWLSADPVSSRQVLPESTHRNTALTILRGILHQWIDLQPHLAKEVKSSFEGAETAKYTTSSFVALLRGFLSLLNQITSSQVVCVLDGLDECEKASLRQLLDAVESYLSKSREAAKPRLKLMILSRPQPAVWEIKLGRYQQIQFDASDTEITHDVEKYIFAKVAELASEQDLSEAMVVQVQQILLAGADGTFLWVAFIVNELQGRSWSEIDRELRQIPKGLGGIYQRLLRQVDDKEALLQILEWVVLVARPLTLQELAVAAGVKAAGTMPATQVTRRSKNFIAYCSTCATYMESLSSVLVVTASATPTAAVPAVRIQPNLQNL